MSIGSDNRQFVSLRILDGTALKLIAMISMVSDHVGDSFFPDQIWMRLIGRMALPIFALISEIPFDLVTSGKVLEVTHQNIMVTFFWAILALICFEAIRKRETKISKAFSWAVLMAAMAGSLVFGMDYSFLALGIIFIYYLLFSRAPV